MMKNKLLFEYKENWGNDYAFVADNHKDLEEYLKTIFHKVSIEDDIVYFKQSEWSDEESVTLKWVKHI